MDDDDDDKRKKLKNLGGKIMHTNQKRTLTKECINKVGEMVKVQGWEKNKTSWKYQFYSTKRANW